MAMFDPAVSLMVFPWMAPPTSLIQLFMPPASAWVAKCLKTSSETGSFSQAVSCATNSLQPLQMASQCIFRGFRGRITTVALPAVFARWD
eukprot:1142459-Pelagomonas_calceolata.AAC.6